jgi:4-hydroxy-tetrahydrodipicolinate reductase
MSERLPRVLVFGASGRMGQALLRLGSAHSGLELVAGVSRAGGPYAIAPWVPGFESLKIDSVPAFDVAIDFSLPGACETVFGLCARRGAALVSGTTGLEPPQVERLGMLSQRVPVLWASNFSLGVAVLNELVAQAAAALPQWDADIVESHHALKKDAPSGTALSLGETVERQRGFPPHYASLRAGDIVGEHTVQFTGPGERIELTHRATNRDVFARGALEAAVRLAGRAPGRYRIADLFLA